jgi:hypothetical protein
VGEAAGRPVTALGETIEIPYALRPITAAGVIKSGATGTSGAGRQSVAGRRQIDRQTSAVDLQPSGARPFDAATRGGNDIDPRHVAAAALNLEALGHPGAAASRVVVDAERDRLLLAGTDDGKDLFLGRLDDDAAR